MKILLDPGHGGKDPGVVWGSTLEKHSPTIHALTPEVKTMKYTLLLPLLLLAACSNPPTHAPKPSQEVIFVDPAKCREIRVILEDGSISRVFGVVPEAGFNLAIPIKQIECRRNGVFGPLEAR